MSSILIRHGILAALLVFAAGGTRGDSEIREDNDGAFERMLTAGNLASRVLAANPGLAAIIAAAEVAAYRVDPAGSLDDPMLSYAVAPLTIDADHGLNQKLDFSQKFPWPGTLAARKAVADHEAVAAGHDADALRLKIIAEAKAAYAEWGFVSAALEINAASHSLLAELKASAKTRYAAGRASRQDVLHAAVEQAAIDNELLRLRTSKATVQARINALLNRAPDEPLPAAAPVTLFAAPPTLQDLQKLALSQHPELSRLDALVAANESRVTVAEKAFYPDFQVGVGYNSLWDDTDKRPVFGVSINVPLDRSKRRADLNRAKADTRRAEWSRTERRANLLSELAQARAAVLQTHASVKLYQTELVPLAAAYLEAAVTDYKSGQGAFLNVISAERRKLSTDLALARARADYVRRLAELERWVSKPGESIRAAGDIQ